MTPKSRMEGIQTEGSFVSFGDVARRQLGQQGQYACRYTGLDVQGDGVANPSKWGELGYPDLGRGLRFRGNTGDYHSMRIHQEDVAEFVRRYQALRMNGAH